MKRVIVKAKLFNKTEFVKMLQDIGMDFSEPFWQHDRVFTPRNYESGKNLPRIELRAVVKDADKPAVYALVLRRHIGQNGVSVVNYTTVKDYTETASMLQQMGFELNFELSRQRQELNMGESVKVYLDKIDGLDGYFAKFEANLIGDDNPEEVREDLVRTFEVLKVGRENIIEKNYGELIQEVNNGKI